VSLAFFVKTKMASNKQINVAPVDITGLYNPTTNQLVLTWRPNVIVSTISDPNANRWIVRGNQAIADNPAPGRYNTVRINGVDSSILPPVIVPQAFSDFNLSYDMSTDSLNLTWKSAGSVMKAPIVTDRLNGVWKVAGNSASLKNPVPGRYFEIFVNGKPYFANPVTVLKQAATKSFDWTSWWMILIYVLIGLIILGLLIWLIFILAKPKPSIETITVKSNYL
jgi:hypothetical protein